MNFKQVIRNFAILVASVILGMLLICVAFCIPVNQEHKQEAYTLLEEEGWYPDSLEQVSRKEELFHSHKPGILDYSTEKIIVHLALDEREESLLDRGVFALYDETSYPRYWHGYVLPLRALFILFDLNELRMLNFLMQFVLCLVFSLRFYRIRPVLAFLPALSYVLLMPIALAQCIQFSSIYYVGTIGAVIILAKTKKFWKDPSLIFIVLGILTSYTDLLTYPVYALCFPLLTLLVCAEEQHESIIGNVVKVMNATVWWVIGYVCMWFGKPLLGSILVHQNLFDDFLTNLSKRSGADLSVWTMGNRWQSILLNLSHYGYVIYLLVILLGIGLVLYRIVVKRAVGWDDRLPAIMLIALIPVGYNFVIAEHTSGHHFFAYRNWNTGICALALFLILLTYGETRQVTYRVVGILSFAGAGMLAIAFGMMSTQRGDIYITNGNLACEQLEIQDEVMFSYTPAYDTLSNMVLCGTSESEEGVLQVLILEDGNVISESEVDANELVSNTYVGIELNMALDTDRTYQVKIIPENTSGKIFAFVSSEDVLQELGPIIENEGAIDKYPLMGFSYFGNTLTRNEKIAEMIIIWLYLMAFVICGCRKVVNLR